MGTFLVIGLVNGVVFGLAAVGLVLVYKGTRVFNVAQGEFGTLAMFLLYLLHEAWDMPYLVAVIVGLLGAVAMALATERLVVRPLKTAPPVITLVGTAGVALVTIGLTLVIGKPEPRVVDSPIGGDGFQLLNFIISPQQILSMLVLIAIAVAAAIFFQRTYLGMAILANSQDGTAARLVGANANRISQLTWGIAGLLGGIAGVVLAPQVTIVPGYMTTHVLVAAFTAGVVGGMTSLVGAFVAGEIIGVAEALGRYAMIKSGAISEIPEFGTVVVFLLLVLMLLVRPNGLLGGREG